MKRTIITDLQTWKTDPARKPLILTGTRQVGKTYALKTFGQQQFKRCHYVNFEQDEAAKKIFSPNLVPKRMIEALSFHLDTAIDIHTDLVIFDEIQACPLALTSLKYFCEDMPALALCAAGSLLGIHLNPASYPVGKVNLLHLSPMTFTEFLGAIDDQRALDCLTEATHSLRIPSIAHEHLWNQLKYYFIVGGLPEAVKTYCAHQDNHYEAAMAVRSVQKQLIQTYYGDMAKHSGKVNAMHIDRLWRSVPAQLSNVQDKSAPKFKCKGIIPGINRYNGLVNVIDWLDNAGLVMKNAIIETPQIPLSAYAQENKFKLFLFDIGILGAMINLAPKTLLDYGYGTYQGYFAENFIAQSLRANHTPKLFSWQKNTSEIEFLSENEGVVIPIEVKSGCITQAKSLKVFMDRYHPPYSILFSGKPLHIDQAANIHRLPLYCVDYLNAF